MRVATRRLPAYIRNMRVCYPHYPRVVPAMASKRPKRPKDFSQAGKLVVDIATGPVKEEMPAVDSPATEFARQGGLKGGIARAASLSPEQRKEIAKKAAARRWSKKKP